MPPLKHKRVIVLCPSDYSLYTLATVASLHRAGVSVAGVGLLRLVNPRRVLSEARRDGARLLKKVWTKLVRRSAGYRAQTQETIPHFLKQNDIILERVSALCARENIPVRRTYDFNSGDFVDWTRAQRPDLMVFTGGGLLRADLIGVAALGILNCHMGILPEYRGMDLPEWAILNGDLHLLGCCVHRIDSGVDTGPILRNYQVELKAGDDVRRLRQRIEYRMCSALPETAVEYLEQRIEPRPQQPEQGRQVFIMAPALLEIVHAKLERLSKAA